MIYTFFGRGAEFFFGMLLAKIVLAKGVQQTIHQFPKYTTLGGIGIVAALFLMSRFQTTCTYGADTLDGTIVNNLVLPIFTATLFYGLIHEGSIMRKLLGSRIMVFLGKTSYAFYLIHVGILQYSRNLPGKDTLLPARRGRNL